MIKSIDDGFYSINPNYLKYLNKIDSEVYYSLSYESNTKPFVGIIIGIEEYNYFIPISSAKIKHKSWKNVSNEHFLIYEIKNNSEEKEGNIYKNYSDTKKLHLLSILDMKKMIPVPVGEYEKIIFENIEDIKYKDLFRKEYAFYLSIKEKVLKKVEKIYIKQRETKIIGKGYCNFLKLEEAMLNWKK